LGDLEKPRGLKMPWRKMRAEKSAAERVQPGGEKIGGEKRVRLVRTLFCFSDRISIDFNSFNLMAALT